MENRSDQELFDFIDKNHPNQGQLKTFKESLKTYRPFGDGLRLCLLREIWTHIKADRLSPVEFYQLQMLEAINDYHDEDDYLQVIDALTHLIQRFNDTGRRVYFQGDEVIYYNFPPLEIP